MTKKKVALVPFTEIDTQKRQKQTTLMCCEEKMHWRSGT